MRNKLVRNSEHDIAVAVGEAGCEDFREEGADLFFGKVDHTDDLFAYELFFGVMFSDLSARLFDTYFSTEIDLEFICGFFGLRKVFDFDDGAYAEFDFLEVEEGNGLHYVALSLHQLGINAA